MHSRAANSRNQREETEITTANDLMRLESGLILETMKFRHHSPIGFQLTKFTRLNDNKHASLYCKIPETLN